MQTQEKTIPADPFAPELQPLSLVEVPAKPVAPVQQHSARVITPGDLLRIATESGDKDLDRLERLMRMEREYRAEQARIAFREDFAKFKALNIVVPKTKLVKQKAKGGGPGPTYWQSELSVVADLLQPALSQFGFGYRFDVKFGRSPFGEGGWCTVTCKLEHRLGHTEELTLEGPPDDSGAKNPLQEMQSSSTFLQRHAVLAITGTPQAGADNDGRGARGYADDAGGEVEPERQAAAANELQALLTEGNKKASEGSKAVVFWWGRLTDGQRELLMPHFSGIKAEARKHDGGAK